MLVTGLCRLLARNGVRVAPFKAQNMALNSAVTASGHEIGRAQYLQAEAAGIEPESVMNPILLKPTGERTSQVIVLGQAIGTMTATEYHDHKPTLLSTVLDSLNDLRDRFDVVLCEGAGSPTEINLLAHDIVNLRVAHAAGLPAIVVGDIDRGGVFASLYGTVALLPPELRACVRGFVINKLRGDPALLLDGTSQLEAACSVPTLGVIPMLPDLALDAEDSLALPHLWQSDDAAALDVAVVGFPRISNFTDFDPLAAEAGVGVRLVRSVGELGRPHLIVLPGTKATVDDLAWLRHRGFDRAIATAVSNGATVLGVCGGYQMLGTVIDDGVESGAGRIHSLGLLPVTTRFDNDKVLRRDAGEALGCVLHGYQIHHGRVVAALDAERWLTFGGSADGVCRDGVYGTTAHGLFHDNDFRRAFLAIVAGRAGVAMPPSSLDYEASRQAMLDGLADALEVHLDLDRIGELIMSAARQSA